MTEIEAYWLIEMSLLRAVGEALTALLLCMLAIRVCLSVPLWCMSAIARWRKSRVKLEEGSTQGYERIV